ncbi:hypothetical protein AB4Y85_08440 [Microvirga sp. 2YAF29]|uniref:hypothetical protein n=1 Tax=Microvirga sp. 2YAF29 TaxID=3233031 RepID=UPI003F9D482B
MSLLFGAVILLSPFWLALLWLQWGHRLWMRLSMVALWSLLTVGFAWMFYERYWRWADCFNELGRCYDSEAGVMVAQAAFIWGMPALVSALLLALSLWALLKRKITP